MPRPPVENHELAPSIGVRESDGATRAVVLVLYGGKAVSRDPSQGHHLSAVRMQPFAFALHQVGKAHAAAVWTVRYRYRGWNGAEASPVVDARWALHEVRRVHGDVPVVLVGHSMGGRTALAVADDPLVSAVVALAPWLPPKEPVEGVRDRRVLIVHGTRDRWTDPAGSLAYARRAQPVARELTRIELVGAGHFMFRRSAVWHQLTTTYVERELARQSAAGPTTNTPSRRDALTKAAGDLRARV